MRWWRVGEGAVVFYSKFAEIGSDARQSVKLFAAWRIQVEE